MMLNIISGYMTLVTSLSLVYDTVVHSINNHLIRME